MKSIQIILRSLFLDQKVITELCHSSQWNKWSNIITIIVGLYYGIFNMMANLPFITSFESAFLRVIFVPVIFIIGGILMIFFTRFGFTLLLWAGAKALGGSGLLGAIYRITGFAMIPLLLSIPPFIALAQSGMYSLQLIIFISISLLWIYFYLVKAIKSIQQFKNVKAYSAVFLAYLFMTSVYYILVPLA